MTKIRDQKVVIAKCNSSKKSSTRCQIRLTKHYGNLFTPHCVNLWCSLAWHKFVYSIGKLLVTCWPVQHHHRWHLQLLGRNHGWWCHRWCWRSWYLNRISCSQRPLGLKWRLHRSQRDVGWRGERHTTKREILFQKSIRHLFWRVCLLSFQFETKRCL